MSAGLGLALLVQKTNRFNAVMRSLFFAPQMVSLVVVALVWQLLLVDKIGIVSRLAPLVGLGGLSLLGDPELRAATPWSSVSVWFLMGFYMLIFLGGLQDIPSEYYEAARIDGAGPVASFWYITLPLLEADQLLRAAGVAGRGRRRRPGVRPDLRHDQGRAGQLDLAC